MYQSFKNRVYKLRRQLNQLDILLLFAAGWNMYVAISRGDITRVWIAGILIVLVTTRFRWSIEPWGDTAGFECHTGKPVKVTKDDCYTCGNNYSQQGCPGYCPKE